MLHVLMALFGLGGRQKLADMTDDQLLGEYSKTGNHQAFAELYQRYLHLALGVCMKYLKDTTVAEDAVMDVFEKLLTDLRAQDVQQFKPWLYTVCKNHCLMQLRSNNSVRVKAADYDVFVREFMENGEEMHPLSEPAGDQLKRLEEALAELPEEQQHCVQLFYLEKKSYKEIETITGFDDKKVKSYIQNGKRNLKIKLTGKA